MAAVAPRQVAPAPLRTPLPFGLFSVLGLATGGELVWENGIKFEGLTCEPAGGIGAPDCDPELIPGLPKDLDGGMGPGGEASPITIYGHFQCSPIGGGFERAQAMSDQHLQVRAEARVEQALWTGDLGNVPNFAGANGFAAPVDLGVRDLHPAVALLEQEIAVRYGSQGVIHMSRENATLLDKHLRVQGGRLFTLLGTPVVAGTGYASDRIIGTGAMTGYRGDVFTSSNRPGDLLDRANNNMYAVSEQSYLVGFEECALLEVGLVPEPI